MVLERQGGDVLAIQNRVTGELITVSIAGAAEPGKQFVAVGLPAGYRVRVEEAGCTTSNTNLFASTDQFNSFKNIHHSSHSQRCQSEAANLRNLQNDTQRL